MLLVYLEMLNIFSNTIGFPEKIVLRNFIAFSDENARFFSHKLSRGGF